MHRRHRSHRLRTLRRLIWGTSATWVPELDLTVTLTVNQPEAWGLVAALQDGVIDIAAEYSEAA